MYISAGTDQATSIEIPHAKIPPQHADTQSTPTNVHMMVTRSKNNIHQPRQSSDDFIQYPLPRALIAENVPMKAEPTLNSQASKSIQWRETMNREFLALMHNGTWSLVSPLTIANIVGCRLIYEIKKKANETIERYKA